MSKSIATNMIFILSDMLEKCFDALDESGFKLERIENKYERKSLIELRYWSAIVRQRTSEMQMNSQITFGEETDHLMRLMLTSIDRTGDNMRIFTLIQNYINAFESQNIVDIKKFGL